MFAGVEDTGLLGYGSTMQERAVLAVDASNAPAVAAHGHSTMSHWFFQMVRPPPSCPERSPNE